MPQTPPTGKANLIDASYYKVSVTRAVTVVGKLQWRPGDDIEATGALIKQLDALPENAGAIEDNPVEVIQEAV